MAEARGDRDACHISSLKCDLEAKILILDEPTRNFSPLSTPVIFNLLEQYQGCIISISHDRSYLRQICSSIYQLTENGLERLEDAFKET